MADYFQKYQLDPQLEMRCATQRNPNDPRFLRYLYQVRQPAIEVRHLQRYHFWNPCQLHDLGLNHDCLYHNS